MKSIDHALKKAVTELGYPEGESKVVVMEYWDTIYKKLLGGKETAITVRHVGTFAISKYKLAKMIAKMIAKLRRVRKSVKLSEEKKQEILDDTKKRLTLACKHRDTIAKEYAENFGNI